MKARKVKEAQTVTFMVCGCGEPDCNSLWIMFSDESKRVYAVGSIERGELIDYAGTLACLPCGEAQAVH